MSTLNPNGFIKVTQGPDIGRIHAIGEGIVLGRLPTCGVILTDPAASRQHVRITLTPEGYVIDDLGSSNGTFVNGKRVKRTLLRPGDVIRICRLEFSFGIGDFAQQVSQTRPAPAQEPTPPRQDVRVTQRIAPKEQDEQARKVKLTGDEAAEDEEQRIIHSIVDVDEHNIAKDVLLAKSEEELKKISRRFEIISDLSNQISTILDLDRLLNSVMDRLFEVFPNAERGYVLMTDPETGELDLDPKVVRRRHVSDSSELQISKTIVNKAIAEKQGILLSDAAQDDRFEAAVSLMRFNIRSMMCVPLICQNQVLGIISIDTTRLGRKFMDDDLRLLTAIASPIATALRNAQLVKEKEGEIAIRTSLQRFFSPTIVEEIVQGRLSTEMGGKRMEGIAFFCDIVGFTKMSNRLKAEDVVDLLNRYFEEMVDILFRHNATIDKFSGDAIMAVWGAPKPVENGEWHAVQAGLEMQNVLFEFNCAQLARKEETIHMGIGINYGSFIAGNMGAKAQDIMNYTIIGEDVNLAARIEAKAGAGQVYISGSAYEKVKSQVCAIELPPTELKGIPGPVLIFSIRGIRPIDSQGSSGLVLSMPVELFVDGRQLGPAHLAGAKLADEGKVILELLSMEELQQGAGVQCRVIVNELPDFSLFNARVLEQYPRREEGPAINETRLLVQDPPAELIDVLTPGKLLEAGVSWDVLIR